MPKTYKKLTIRNPTWTTWTSLHVAWTSNEFRGLLFSVHDVLERAALPCHILSLTLLFALLEQLHCHALPCLVQGMVLHHSFSCPTSITWCIFLNLKTLRTTRHINIFLLYKIHDNACSIICSKLTSSLRVLTLTLTYTYNNIKRI